VALNLALGAVVAALKLPVYLDSVGTILVAVLAGPVAGAITGILSNVVLGLLSSPVFLAFSPVAAVIGLSAGVAARFGAFRSPWSAAVAGLMIGVLAGLSSVPIALALFGGVTASGTGIVTIVLRGLGLPLYVAVGVASISTDIIDKSLSAVLVALLVVRLPRRLVARLGAARA
jgi:energy-coupling factor transport system substrate-specific component